MHKDIIVYGVLALLLVWILIERKLIMTTRYTVAVSKLPKGLDNTSFVVLADLHNNTFGKKNKRLIKRIDALEPDFIVAAGDIINKKNSCYPGPAFTLLEQLAKRYKVYYAYGNHEQKLERLKQIPFEKRTQEEEALYSTWAEYKKKLELMDVIFLDNEGITVGINTDKLRITGVSLGEEYFNFHDNTEMDRDYLTSLTGESSKNDYQLLIAHNPVYFTNYAAWGADLILAGHLHGGMVRLPGIGGLISPQARFFPKYDSGQYEHKESRMIVSRGLGSHSVMPRIFNIPELVFVRLKHTV